MKVNILGTEYTVYEDNGLEKLGLDGCCKKYDKEISIRSIENMLEDGDHYESKLERHCEVMRHELIHAFFNESGLDEYGNDEQLVDWLAMQFPKMEKTFKDVGCL